MYVQKYSSVMLHNCAFHDKSVKLDRYYIEPHKLRLGRVNMSAVIILTILFNHDV